MDLRDTPEQARFREEVRSWLQANLPEGWGTPAFHVPEEMGARVDFLRSWQQKLYAGGWMGLAWPREYGGRGASIIESIIYEEEYTKARAPNLINLAVGTDLVGPTLIDRGTD